MKEFVIEDSDGDEFTLADVETSNGREIMVGVRHNMDGYSMYLTADDAVSLAENLLRRARKMRERAVQ